MRPALCLAVTALAVGLTGCSSDGPTIRQAAATPAPPTAPSADVVLPSAAPVPTAAATAPPTSAPVVGGTDAPTTVATEPPTSAPVVGGTDAPEPPVNTGEPDDPLSPRPGLESAPPPGLPTCEAAALTVTDADALYTTAAVQELFTIRTTGPDCELKGYPTVSLLDGAGRELPAKVSRNGYGLSTAAPKVVTLSKATSVSFFVATSRDGDCQQAATLVTTLPGTGTALRASTPMQVCDAAVGVTPIRRLVDDHELEHNSS